jgi:hypothetical protein
LGVDGRGETAAVRAQWDTATCYPAAHEVELTDSSGREHRFSGTVTAAKNCSAWSNASFGIGLARWKCAGGPDEAIGAWTDFGHAPQSR